MTDVPMCCGRLWRNTTTRIVSGVHDIVKAWKVEDRSRWLSSGRDVIDAGMQRRWVGCIDASWVFSRLSTCVLSLSSPFLFFYVSRLALLAQLSSIRLCRGWADPVWDKVRWVSRGVVWMDGC